ncbi:MULTISPECIES: hypothetical protein [unclassified Candidatus Frackibacter]|uniref:hypothetical protein n=1 Tax=unclassified Candidatus Frackibacter TaxID=2648818 RepID=UPI00079ABD92|nr:MULTISPECIES: hypothetical protein [unclassified Candidatus Frackibacter]KXS45684.1 MAG: hypothetical protein AWU54_257 [Candidatus Frackibacter sp. T328-2]SDC66297.1 hypothetical protein SAMN04515661_11822 [Candidatus Frackibacter sp. WG11]SEM79442.1 hypothetical protein SAMN04488698_11723 [Candidatus Frackibacter sp. WG12]SFL90164.1 hypothetical protein SAMN04488699_11922 [Candidatus Frackibacter sp. WG13]
MGYLNQDDLYKHKLAVILGRGKRLRKMLKSFPSEAQFKAASLRRIGEIIGIKDLESKTMLQLERLDKTYNELTTPQHSARLSKCPKAKKIMCIDTEYLWGDLDSIQYAIKGYNEWLETGIIFTNQSLADSVSIEDGIDLLREIIDEFEPDILVGHNFNCDITTLEEAYGREIPELHNYDDTLFMVRKSNVANIIGGASLDKIVKEIFRGSSIGLFAAYQDLKLFIKYGLKDALYPIYIREYLITGEIPFVDPEVKIDRILKESNWEEVDFDSILFD